MQRTSSISFILLCLLCFGCTTPTSDNGAWVSSTIRERANKKVQWYQGASADALVQEQIHSLLERELTLNAAVQIALLKNPSIQATFEKQGIAQADVIEAGLFTNPLFDAYVRFPDSSHASLNTQVALGANLLDLFLVPLRKKRAGIDFEKAKMEVAHAILSVAYEVEQLFFTLQEAYEIQAREQEMVTIKEVASSLAQKQYESGTISSLTLEQKQSEAQQASTALQMTELEIIKFQKQLSTSMGVSYQPWKLASLNNTLPQQELSLQTLQKRALEERLDIAAKKKEIESLIAIGKEKEWWSYTNGQIGLSSEKEADGLRETGPTLSLLLPFLNSGQAARARLLAEIRQHQDELASLENEIQTEVEKEYRRLIQSKKQTTYYSQVVLPLHHNRIESAIQQYNVMAYGIYGILQEKEESVKAHMHYVHALIEYWKERSSLIFTTGGKELL